MTLKATQPQHAIIFHQFSFVRDSCVCAALEPIPPRARCLRQSYFRVQRTYTGPVL